MTPRQKQALDLIRAGLESTGIAPSYDELKAALGLKSKSNLVPMIRRLVRGGHLVRLPGRSRSLALPTPRLSDVPTADLLAELERRGWKKAA